MSLINLQHICLQEEATEAVERAYSTLFAAGPAGYLAFNTSLGFEVETYKRQIRSGSLTPRQALAGARLGSASFSLEATARGTTIGSFPSFDLPLRACGFRRFTCARVTIGAISGGPFRHGETVTQSTSGATRTVIGDTYDGQTELFVSNTDGAGSGTITTSGGLTWTGSTSGATATDSAVASNKAHAWSPFSTPMSTVTFDATGLEDNLAVGDVIQGVSSSALGIVTEAATSGAAATVKIRRISGHFTSAEQMKRVAPSADADIGNLAAASFEAQLHIPTLSIGMAKDGVREALYGCRGSVAIRGNIGEPLVFEFTFRGAEHSESPTDGAGVANPTVTDRVPPVLLAANVRLGKTGLAYGSEFAPCINSFSLDVGNQVEFRRCMNSATGIEEAHIIAREPTGQIDPELTSEAIYDLVNQFTSNGVQRLRLSAGTTPPDRFDLRLHNLSATSMPDAERNGFATRQMSFGLHSGSQNASAGDNEMVIIWEPTDA